MLLNRLPHLSNGRSARCRRRGLSLLEVILATLGVQYFCLLC